MADVEASASFLVDHFGFTRDMGDDGFVSLSRPDAGFSVIYLRTGLPTFRPAALAGRNADGLLVVFVVDDIDGEYARITAEASTSPHRSRPSRGGERFSR